MRQQNGTVKAGKKEKVVEILNKARGDELAAILQYMVQHYALADADYGPVAANVKLIAIDEMRHAEMLAERIFELGGTPVTAPSTPSKKNQPILEAIELDIELEETAISDYNDFMEVCRECRDAVSAKLVEQIADEEQAHLSYFQNVRDHIKNLGPAYLARLAGGSAETGSQPARGFVAAQGG